MVTIREAAGEVEIGWVRELMREYGLSLAEKPEARICITGYDEELRRLPGVYAPPEGALLLALRDGVAIGCCALKPVKMAERACEMKRLYVGPEARGLGLGRAMIEAAIGWARAAGYAAMVLDTAPAAMPAATR